MISPSSKQVELMKSLTSASWHFVAARRNPIGARLAWDGEVLFIRETCVLSVSFGVQRMTGCGLKRAFISDLENK
jgi:hypothetical protein